MSKRFAVIDLGTNTFHLLIAEQSTGDGFKELYRKRIFIKLAEQGIKTIGAAPLARAMAALHTFKKTLEDYQVSTIRAFGTAALRTASNGPAFIAQVLEQTGIQVLLIPGDREAALIYKGVLQAVPMSEMGLIMDIGGGSVEFIFADHTGLKWAKSFPVGVAVLFNHFHQQNPITPKETQTLHQYLNQELTPVLEQIKQYNPKVLIGASGTFDVLEDILCDQKRSPHNGIVAVSNFHVLFKKLITTTLEERLAMDDIPNTRAEMIIVALVLIQFILLHSSITTISVSAYAMKEGMLQELIQENKFLD